jgi:hypothetical protein
MASTLKKDITRELTSYPGIIITMTQDGITFKVKRKHTSKSVSWAQIFGVAGLTGDNAAIVDKASQIVLRELSYNQEEWLKQENGE